MINKSKIESFATVGAGQGAPQKETHFSVEGFPFIRAGHLEELLKGKSELDLPKVNEETARQHKLKLYKPGTIVFAKSGMSATKGRIYKLQNTCYIVNHLAALELNDSVSPDFIMYALRAYSPVKLINDLSYPSISQCAIEKHKIPLPSLLSDQIRIATILSKAEALLSQRKESLRLLDELLKSTFLEMCGDPVRNEKGWKKKKLGEIIQEFKYGTNVISVDKPSENTIAILRIPNIINESITYEGLKYSILEEREKERVRLKKGDLLFVRSNGNPNYIGRCAVFNDDIVCGYASYLIRARLREGVLITPFFLKAILSFPRYRNVIVSKAKKTAGNYNINIESLKSLIIIAPPPKLQTQFTRIVEKVEALKAHYQDSLKKLENLYGSLSQRAFKGEL